MAITAVDLFCVGSLYELREPDVTIFVDAKDGSIWVYGLEGAGAVLGRPGEGPIGYDSTASATVVQSEKVRRLRAGSYYDDLSLTLWPDHPGSPHWNWPPTKDMLGAEFINALVL
jgi:hypothetical protein